MKLTRNLSAAVVIAALAAALPSLSGAAVGAGSSATSVSNPWIGASPRQKVLRSHRLVLRVTCFEACTVSLGGDVKVGSRHFPLAKSSVKLAANARRHVYVYVPRRTRLAIARRLAEGRRPTAIVRDRWSYSDGASGRGHKYIRIVG